jgi:glycosyltransferase involved in cell wall biosynthesis
MPAVLLDALAQGRTASTVVPAADVWHARGLLAVPVALALRRRHGGRVVYDVGDLYLDARNLARLAGPIRALVGRWERGLARRADALVTVNDGYRKVLAERFGRSLTVVYNSPDARPVIGENRIRGALGLSPETGIILYHGGLTRDRGIEQLIAAMPDVPGAVLVLMGYGDLEAKLAAGAAADSTGRVRLLPAVPPDEVLAWVANADVAAMLIQPTTLNHRLTTPNKLFEAMAAGTPVLAADLPGMRPVVEASGCGRVIDPTDVAAIAVALREMVGATADQRTAWSEGGRRSIDETYGWARQLDTLTDVYRGLTGRPW